MVPLLAVGIGGAIAIVGNFITQVHSYRHRRREISFERSLQALEQVELTIIRARRGEPLRAEELDQLIAFMTWLPGPLANKALQLVGSLEKGGVPKESLAEIHTMIVNLKRSLLGK
ncbi:hypothetical protein [uncultured Maricaulis sp.]|uniref:hypothetical protein n=1 Tax=uncultured Maricaulis sp. TaxID=174710 RepID=UPI0030DC91A1|tara:strand:- start:30711 stop:31058 length:348 start_codon:yes stop_codon:yes gene_type:complete